MAATVDGVHEANDQWPESSHNGLFGGRKLWFSQAIPQRTWLMQKAELHGAQIVPLEQQADIKLVDHLRKNQAPGTHSYRYIELSIQNGVLEDLNAHRVGSASRVERPVGSAITAGKGSRNKFTDDEDQVLWNWIKPLMDAGGTWKGLEVYKQLESRYPCHTYQSWRDRWIKHTQFQKRKITSHDPDEGREVSFPAEESSRSAKQRRIGQRQPQRANIGVVQSSHTHIPRQGPLLQQAANEGVMGNSESSQANAQGQYEHRRIHDVNVYNNVEEAKILTQPNKIYLAPEHEIKVRSEDRAKHKRKSKSGEGSERNAEKEANSHVEAIGHSRKNTTKTEIEDAESSVIVDDKRLPLAYNFTQEEARMLYKATCHILDARSDKLDESWAGVATEYGHTKEAWRTFFYDFIVPEYKKRHGITTETELEAHYKEQLRERRELKASIAKQQMLDDEGNTTEPGQEAPQAVPENNIDSSKYQMRESGTDTNVHEIQNNQAHNQSLTVGEEFQKSQPLLSQTSFADQRPPKPNESRKLSQVKGSQSISSQSRSQSVGTPQPSQHLQNSHRLAATLGPPENAALDVASEHDLNRFKKNPETSGQRQKLSGTNPEAQLGHVQKESSIPAISPKLQASQRSEECQEYSGRFVTQISQDHKLNSTEISSELQDIPYRPPTPLQRNSKLVTSANVPEEPVLSSRSREDTEAEANSNMTSSYSAVQHVEDGDKLSEIEHGSKYARSGILPQSILFKGQIKLSQARETASKEKASENDLGNKIGASEDPVTPIIDQVLPDKQHTVSTPRSKFCNSQNVIDECKTVPTTLLTGPETTQPDKHPDRYVSDTDRTDTQALFQQFVPTNLVDHFAIPEPPGGWEGEDEVSLVDVKDNSAMQNPGHNYPQEPADWILPLPDLITDHEDMALSAPEDDGEADIETWLADQSKMYSSIPSALLNYLSHRALESTSMDLNMANSVLAYMVDRFEKGKHPAHLHINNLKELPKKERKSAIPKIVDYLQPDHMSGCWTAGDDKALLGVNGREIKRVEDKHGEDRVRKRFEFLEMWHSR